MLAKWKHASKSLTKWTGPKTGRADRGENEWVREVFGLQGLEGRGRLVAGCDGDGEAF